MENKTRYFTIFVGMIALIVVGVSWWRVSCRIPPSVLVRIDFSSASKVEQIVDTHHFPAISIPKSVQGISLKIRSFDHLTGWHTTKLKPSFEAFQISCRTFMHDNPNHRVGSPILPLKAKDWYPACQAANQLTEKTEHAIRQFFETWFTPIEFSRSKPVQGLFTGYYVPLIQASLKRSNEYPVPIYAEPSTLITANLSSFSKSLPHKKIRGYISKHNMMPFYSRAEINRGAIAHTAKVLAWVKNEIDRLMLETEGSGIVQLKEGRRMALGYASDNGAHYRSLASLAIEKGYMSKNMASMPHIRSYFEQHPSQLKPLIEQNQSFVFFRKLPEDKIFGSQGVPLSPGYSMAVDRRWIPMGTPLWLSTELPTKESDKPVPFNRLFIAQDVGGSIRGMVRGDIYWGPGEEAAHMGNHVQGYGTYCLLIPSKKPTEYVRASEITKEKIA